MNPNFTRFTDMTSTSVNRGVVRTFAMPWVRGWAAILALVIGFTGAEVPGQDTNGLPTGADAAEAMDLSQTNEVAEPDNLPAGEELTSTNGPSVSQTNRAGQSSSRDGRSRRSRRQRQNSSNNGNSAAPASFGAASSTNGASALDYSAFRLVADRNIFNPNRQPNRPDFARPKPKAIDTFGLVGIMSYEKGTFAFFDGSSSEFRKALKANDSIAGYQLAAIDENWVKLVIQTNTLQMRIGGQMRREDEGPWVLLSQAESTPANFSTSTGTGSSAGATGSSTSDAAPSGADSDILKKLMQRREQE